MTKSDIGNDNRWISILREAVELHIVHHGVRAVNNSSWLMRNVWVLSAVSFLQDAASVAAGVVVARSVGRYWNLKERRKIARV